jgi:hypothetical protein
VSAAPNNPNKEASTPTMQTYDEILTRHDVDIPPHLDAQTAIPVLAGLQVQGDIVVIPRRRGKHTTTSPVPADGIAVIRGENGGHTHLLVADGDVTWSPAARAGQTLGTVDVADDATAYMLHPEHGANALAPGSYELRRQREQADQIRMVAD